MLGTVIELSVAKLVSRNSDGIKENSVKLFKKVFKPKSEKAFQ